MILLHREPGANGCILRGTLPVSFHLNRKKGLRKPEKASLHNDPAGLRNSDMTKIPPFPPGLFLITMAGPKAVDENNQGRVAPRAVCVV